MEYNGEGFTVYYMKLKGTKFQQKVWKYLKTIQKAVSKPINRWQLQ